jgi:PAS domain S-box-containing protein
MNVKAKQLSFAASVLSRATAYSVVLFLVLLVTLFKYWLLKYLGIHAPYLLMGLTILCCASLFGMGPGLLAAIAGFVPVNMTLYLESGNFVVSSYAVANFLYLVESGAFLCVSFVLEHFRQRLVQAEKLQREQKQKLIEIIESLPVGLACFDTELNFVMVNSTYARWRNQSTESIVGHNLGEIVEDETAYAISVERCRLVLTGLEQTYEVQAPFWDGIKHIRIHATPSRNIEGAINGFISVLDDVTIERELQESRLHAIEKVNQSKSDFVAHVSHEIRTPLSVILGCSRLLNSPELILSQEDREVYGKAVQRNGELLSSIVDDILDMSKIEAGKLEVNRERVSLNELIADTETSLFVKAREKGLELVIVPLGYSISIETDPLRLKQIFFNIIGNAIKFTKAGSVSLQLALNQEEGQTKVLSFIVQDTGIGLTEEQAQRLFRPFEQSDSSITKNFGGSGLGLYLSKNLARMLGGDIVLSQSKLGQGSIFVVSIDPGHVIIMDEIASLPTRMDQAPLLPHFAIRVLLADDTPDVRMLSKFLLERLGAQVVEVSNGQEALESFRTDTFDLIFLDIQMPIMDGYTAAREIRKYPSHPPLIALTAHAMADERSRIFEAGFYEHIAKPIEIATLAAKIDKCLNRKLVLKQALEERLFKLQNKLGG